MNSLTLPRWFGRRKKPKKKEEAILKANGLQHPVHTPLASLTPPLATSRLFEHDVDSVGEENNGLDVGSLRRRKDYSYNTDESSRRPKSAFILDHGGYSQGDLLGYNVYENLQFSTLTRSPQSRLPPLPHQTTSHRQLPTRLEQDLNVNDLKYIQQQEQQDEDGGRYRPQTTSTPLGPSSTSNRLDNPSMDFLVAGSTDFFEEDDIYQVCGGVADPHSIEYQQDLGCFNDFRSLSCMCTLVYNREGLFWLFAKL